MQIPVTISTDPDTLNTFNTKLVRAHNLTLVFALTATDGQPVDPDPLDLFFFYRRRRGGDPVAVDVVTVDSGEGTCSIDVDVNLLTDTKGYDLELKFYPTASTVYIIAKGRLDIVLGTEDTVQLEAAVTPG
jgi:hypothetical protein